MPKLYLDIDGVLLTAKHTKAAPGVEIFVDFITQHFDCYWLTTHCKGDSRTAIRYLAQFLPPPTLARLEATVQPTYWDALKTEAIDLASDFYWVDDSPFQAEIARLQASKAVARLIVVDLACPNELATLQVKLQASQEAVLTPSDAPLTAQHEKFAPTREKVKSGF